MKLHN
jgi:aspartate beta-hydroxylase